MSTAEERAAGALTRLERRRPDVVRLAVLASLAVRVDANLLRRLRTTLLPDADVGAEADLWYSTLVESRGVHGFVFDAAATPLLRSKLAEDRTLLARATAITAEAHRTAPATIRLEEEVNAAALAGGDEAAARIDGALRPAVLAMVRDDDQGLDIARWALRALPRFHPLVRTTECGVLLAIGAAARLGRDPLIDRVDTAASVEADHRWVLPADFLASRWRLGVQLIEDGVRFVRASEGGHTLHLPRTSPLLVTLLWDADGREERRTVDVAAGTVVRLGRGIEAVRIRTVAGDEFRLEAAPPATLPASAVVDIVAADSDEDVSGVVVAPDRIVAPAAYFRDLRDVEVRRGRKVFRARVLNRGPTGTPREGAAPAIVEGDLIVLEPLAADGTGDRLDSVLHLHPTAAPRWWKAPARDTELALKQSAPERAEAGASEPADPVVVTGAGEAVPTVLLDWDDGRDELTLEASGTLPDGVVGAPVIWQQHCVGIVTRSAAAAEAVTLHAAGHRAIAEALSQADAAGTRAATLPVVELWPVGKGGEATLGFIVAADRIVTAAGRLRDVAEVTVQQRGRLYRARPLRPPDAGPAASTVQSIETPSAGDVLVLEPVDAAALAPVLRLEPRPARTEDATRPDAAAKMEVATIDRGRVVRLAAAPAPSAGDTTRHLSLTLEQPDVDEAPVPGRGAPVLADGAAIGMVVRTNALFGQTSIDAVGAATILQVLEAARGWSPAPPPSERADALAPLGQRMALMPVLGPVGAGKSDVIALLADDEYGLAESGFREVVQIRRNAPPTLSAELFAIESAHQNPALIALNVEHAAAVMIVAEADDDVAKELARWIGPVRAARASVPLFLVATRADVHRYREAQTRAELDDLIRAHAPARAVLFETSTNAGSGELLRRLGEDIDWRNQPGGDDRTRYAQLRAALQRTVLHESRPVVRLDWLRSSINPQDTEAGPDADLQTAMQRLSTIEPSVLRSLLPVAGVRFSDAANVAFIDPETFERLAVTFFHEGGRRGDMVIPWARRGDASGKELDRIMDEQGVDEELREAARHALIEQLERTGAIRRVPLPRDEIIVYLSLFRPRSHTPPEIRRPVPLLNARAAHSLWPAALAAAAHLEATRRARVRDSFEDAERPLRSLVLGGTERTTRFWIESRDRPEASLLQLVGAEEAGDHAARSAFRTAFEQSFRLVAPSDVIIERPDEDGGEGPPPAV